MARLHCMITLQTCIKPLEPQQFVTRFEISSSRCKPWFPGDKQLPHSQHSRVWPDPIPADEKVQFSSAKAVSPLNAALPILRARSFTYLVFQTTQGMSDWDGERKKDLDCVHSTFVFRRFFLPETTGISREVCFISINPYKKSPRQQGTQSHLFKFFFPPLCPPGIIKFLPAGLSICIEYHWLILLMDTTCSLLSLHF